jgi:hypothetical protein
MKSIWILLITIFMGCTTPGGYVPVVTTDMKKDMLNEFKASTTLYVEPITGQGFVSKKFFYKGNEVPVEFNLDEMSLFVANSLSAELEKKGVNLNRNADKIIRVEVLDVNLSYSTNYSVDGMLEFQLSDGYVGSCSFSGSGVKAYRALGGALQWGVANIINHHNVYSFLLEEDTQALQNIPK